MLLALLCPATSSRYVTVDSEWYSLFLLWVKEEEGTLEYNNYVSYCAVRVMSRGTTITDEMIILLSF